MAPKKRDDLEITVKVRNNQLKSRRDELGLSQIDLAKRVGIDRAQYQQLENLSAAPTKVIRSYRCRAPLCDKNQRRLGSKFCVFHLNSTEKEKAKWLAEYEPPQEVIVWKEEAEKLAEFYEVDVKELFPDSLSKVERSSVVSTANVEDFMRMLGIADGTEGYALQPDTVEQAELRKLIEARLLTLTPREEKVLRMRFGIGEKSDHTLAEIAEDWDLTTARIGEIEAKALRKLRNPSRAKYLKDFSDQD